MLKSNLHGVVHCLEASVKNVVAIKVTSESESEREREREAGVPSQCLFASRSSTKSGLVPCEEHLVQKESPCKYKVGSV